MKKDENFSGDKGDFSHRLRKGLRFVKIATICMVIIFVLCILCSPLFYHKILIPAMDATVDYNETVREYNSIVKVYNATASVTSLENINGLVNETYEIVTVDSSWKAVLKSVLKLNSAKKIQKDTDTINQYKQSLEQDMVIIRHLATPDIQWLISRLENVEDVYDIRQVTLTNDPNKMLGYENGYRACLYFQYLNDILKSVEGNDSIEKGTDGGGCIEVFKNKADAINRCDYLAEFNNTILYTGSYALVGNMVVRTSYRLSDEEQIDLTNRIVQQLMEYEQ